MKDRLGKRFALEDELSQWLFWLKNPPPALPTYSELMKHADFDNALKGGRKPLPHQITGASWLLARRAALLADDMGLGKTFTALLAARVIARLTKIQIMVLAPKSLHQHWLEESDIFDLEIDLYSWANLPRDLDHAGTLLIVDEAHFAQSVHTKRTQALLRLTRHPFARAVWLLSGTPMRNGRPKELFSLLAALGHPLSLDQKAFEKYYCDAKFKQYGNNYVWDCSGASHINDLHHLIAPLILKRSKKQLLSLPPKLRKDFQVTLSSEEEKGFNHRVSLIIDDYRDRVSRGVVKSEAETLVFLNAIRQISAEFKLPTVRDLLQEELMKGVSVVVFSSFLRPLKLLYQSLGGELLIGDVTASKKVEIIRRFQNKENNLILATYGSGGQGFTMTRASKVFLLERPWTPGDLEQAEARCHRIGTASSLMIYWFKLGFADEFVDSLLNKKTESIESFENLNSSVISDFSLSKKLHKMIF